VGFKGKKGIILKYKRWWRKLNDIDFNDGRNTPCVTLLIKLKQPIIVLYKIQNNLSKCLV
jgi:hypothetical protein